MIFRKKFLTAFEIALMVPTSPLEMAKAGTEPRTSRGQVSLPSDPRLSARAFQTWSREGPKA